MLDKLTLCRNHKDDPLQFLSQTKTFSKFKQLFKVAQQDWTKWFDGSFKFFNKKDSAEDEEDYVDSTEIEYPRGNTL